MLQVLIVIHLLLALAMVGVILLQRSEGGALGIGGSGGGLMSGRAAGNLLTRLTAILATGFFITSLVLALLANSHSRQGSLMDAPIEAPQQQQQPAPQPDQQPQQPAAPISH